MVARRILISHASDDPQWPNVEVEQIAQRLKEAGFAIDLDLWVELPLRELGSDIEWQDWMDGRLRGADHVLILDSKEYARRAAADSAPVTSGHGRGIAMEYTYLRIWLYGNRQRNDGRIVRYGIGPLTALWGMDGTVKRFQAPYDETRLIGALLAVNATLDARQSGPSDREIHCTEGLAEAGATPTTQHPVPPDQRRAELAYLHHWLEGDLSEHPSRYVTLAGDQRTTQRLVARRRASFSPALILQTFAAPAGDAPPQPFADALDAYRAVSVQRQRKHLAVLGEPGAGKSFSLERLFCELADKALEDAEAPIPLLLRLGDWTDAQQSIEAFTSAQLAPRLAAHWPILRAQGRAVLLLDAFNEIPVGQRATKAEAVRLFAEDPLWAGVLLSCRERDFVGLLKLPFDTLTLQPLTPLQVLEFLQRWEAPLDPVGTRWSAPTCGSGRSPPAVHRRTRLSAYG